MNDLLKKLSNYNLYNYLIPGTIYSVYTQDLMGLVKGNLFTDLVTFYFVGLVISRIGSVFIEPVLRRLPGVHFSSYKDYMNASIKHVKLELLSEVNNMYRSILAMLIIMLSTEFYFETKTDDYQTNFGLIWLIALFIISYIKQTLYINKRIDLLKRQ